MAEYTPTHEGVLPEGYSPNIEAAALDIYRLLSIFLASPAFAKLRKGNGEYWEAVAYLEEIGEDEITRILLSSAITARVVDDREHGKLNQLAGSCGVLTESLEGKAKEMPLSLREACNKIMHAKKIHFDVEHTEEMQPYFNPTVYLYGSRSSGASWKATIDVIAFAEQYVSVFCKP